VTDQFTVNFGNAKPLVLPPEGTYTLVISDYELKQAKNEDSRSKGFNISLIFNIDDIEFQNFRVYHNLWVAYENPWAAKLFFEALTGRSMDDEEFDPSDPNAFLGEKIGAALVHEVYESNTGQTKTKLAIATPDAFYTV
jgi:hypothetical protein